jgi:hypothetical protein
MIEHARNYRFPRWMKPLSVMIALLVPGVVIAAREFRGGEQLTATRLNELVRDVTNLQTALADVALDKADMYQVEADSGPIPVNGQATAQANCGDANDILLGCTCEGRLNGINQLSFELRRVAANNRQTAASFCACQGFNVGSEGRSLFAIAQCLPVP